MCARARGAPFSPGLLPASACPPRCADGGALVGAVQGRGILLCRRVACSLDSLGKMYMPRSPGSVPRYMLPDMVAAWSG